MATNGTQGSDLQPWDNTYMPDMEPGVTIAGFADLGALTGWAARPSGDTVSLRMRHAVRSPTGDARLHQSDIILSKDQAVLLANMLFVMADRLPPKPAKRWMRKLFG